MTDALPKINIRPEPVARAAKGIEEVEVAAKTPWDLRFTMMVIVMVIVVNASLAMLLGGGRHENVQNRNDENPLNNSNEFPNDNNNDVYISGDDKLILLNQLNNRKQQ